MVKKLISINLITIIALALATPLFSSEDCDSPCCITVETNCCIQQEVVDCPMSMTACETPIAMLLISGPKPHTNQNVDLNASQVGEAIIYDLHIEYYVTSDIQNPSASPPTTFLTPLRI